jgi:MFS transporter, AAHS family, vanillate permease
VTDTVEPLSSASLIAEVIDDGDVSGQQFLVIALCMLFNMVDGFDITAMAVVASSVGSELSLEADKVGMIFSSALAGMVCGSLVLAPISDFIGRRKLIIAGLILVAVSMIFTASATTLTEFVSLRFISGLGAGTLLASQAALAAEYSPEKYRSLAVTTVTCGYPMGAMMTSVVAGFVMPEHGWRGMFLFGGIATIAFAMIALALIPESLKFLLERRPAKALTRANKILTRLGKQPLAELPRVAKESTDQHGTVISNVASLFRGGTWAKTLTLWVSFFLCFSTLYFLMSWIPTLMENSGYSAADGRHAFFQFNFSAIIGIFVLGTLSTHWKLSNLVSGFLFSSAVLMVVFALSPSVLGLLMAITFAIGFTQQGGFTGLYAIAAKVYPTEIRSTGVGWAIGLGRLGAVAGPWVAGYLIAAGLDMSTNYFVFAVPMAIGGILAYRLHVK